MTRSSRAVFNVWVLVLALAIPAIVQGATSVGYLSLPERLSANIMLASMAWMLTVFTFAFLVDTIRALRDIWRSRSSTDQRS